MTIHEHITQHEITATVTGTQRAVDAQVASYRNGTLAVTSEKRRPGKAVLKLKSDKPIVRSGDEFVLTVMF